MGMLQQIITFVPALDNFIYPHFLFTGCVERVLIEKVYGSQGCCDKIPPYTEFFYSKV